MRRRVGSFHLNLRPKLLAAFSARNGRAWILEDFHKVDDNEKSKLSQLMKVFMDLSDDYQDLKIIALGAVDTARQVVEYDPEMRNRVAEIHVSLMTEQEIGSIIDKGEKALNVQFSPQIKRLISKHSNGLASVCHHLCLNMCNAAGIAETVPGEAYHLTRDQCEAAVKTYVEEASDSIKSAFDKAFKQRKKTQYANAQLIVEALSSLNDGGAARADIHRTIQRREPKYPETNLKYLLPRLCTPEYGGIIRFDSNSGLYSFSDPIYRAYALAQFHRQQHNVTAQFVGGDFERVLLRFLNEKMDKIAGNNFHFKFSGKKPGES